MKKMKTKDFFVQIASDVSSDRDGIGIKIYEKEDLVLEIFRDDTKKKREISFHRKTLDLELIEESIETFKREIPWEFQD